MTIQNVINTFINSDIVARLDSSHTIQRGLDIAANPDNVSVQLWVKYVLKAVNASAAEITVVQAIYTDNGLDSPDFSQVKLPNEVAQSYEFNKELLSEFFFFGSGRVLASRIMRDAPGMVAYFALLMNSTSTTAQHIYIALNRLLGDEYGIVLTETEVTTLRDVLVNAGLHPDKVIKLRIST